LGESVLETMLSERFTTAAVVVVVIVAAVVMLYYVITLFADGPVERFLFCVL
jgi:hypothetical protein